MKKIKVFGVQFDVCSLQEAAQRVVEVLVARKQETPKQIVTPNPEMLLEAAQNQIFRTVLNRAWLSVPDGVGILWAATVQNSTRSLSKFKRFVKAYWLMLQIIFRPSACTKYIPNRVSGVDLMKSICSEAANFGIPVFLLGAQEGIAKKTAARLIQQYPTLKIVGALSGSPYDDDFTSIQTDINERKPTLLFVAFGAPNQELWIAKHIKAFPSVKVVMGVGGAFDIISEVRKRAPSWMRKIGLEWLARVIQQPSRIRRIWNAVVRFPHEFLRQL